MQRPFTSGSRQAPDPFDQFLEENNFYRKHTARDASCLFRVISEQMYDTQLHHLAIRKKCVRYMRKHREFFQQDVERDLDEYLDDMSKPKTYGTLVELRAVGYMFQRNVLLFEPFNLGNFYSSRSYFNEVFRVFYTPERHFDSVFTCDYIKDAAICQSICYEILYKDLYKLPDVGFAVEHMLHSPSLETGDYDSEYNEEGYCMRIQLPDGRTFEFDLPNQTNCILENYKLCHFHYSNFPRLSDDLQREMKLHNNRDDYEKNVLCKTADSLLPNKYVSCVRQLLQEGITPFPYKVAKALDPNMYRNIEFDAWNEQRKELKMQNWYNGDSNFKLIRCQQTRVHKIFQVGAKCNVKLCKSENDLYTCHIQEIAVDKGYCIVFIEQLGEKRLVPYESLTPLPPDQFKPWTLPYRFQRHMQKYSSVRFTRHYNYRFKLNGQFAMNSAHDYCTPLGSSGKANDFGDGLNNKEDREHYAAHRNGCYYKLKQYTHFEDFRAHTVEYCTMPLTVEHTNRELDNKTANSVGSGNGSPTNEQSSRATSRSSTVTATNAGIEAHIKTEPNTGGNVNNNGIVEELGNVDGVEQPGIGGAYLLPDFHCFYPVPQYSGMPEDYYGYGYDGALHPPAAALLPASGAGAFYYMCNPAAPAYTSAANNLYMQASSPPHALLSATSPHGAQGAPCYPPPCYSNGSAVNATACNNTAVSYNNLSAARVRQHIPSGGRINWDAQKSVDVNGVDLPSDVATLRHFYNLGLDYYQRHRAENSALAAKVFKDKSLVSKSNATEKHVTLDENENLSETKSDANNNSMHSLMSNTNTQMTNSNSANGSAHSAPNSITSNQSQGGTYNKPNYPHRRFPPRFFNNNKDRPNFQRQPGTNGFSGGSGGGGPNSLAPSTTQSRAPHEYNNNAGGGGNSHKHSHNVKSGNVHTNPNAPPRQGILGGGNNNMNVNSPEHHSPMGNFERGGSNNGNMNINNTEGVQTPLSAYPSQNPILTYGSYDYADDPMTSLPLPNAPAAMAANAAGGVYIQMPFAPPPYGMYAVPPPPLGTPHQALGVHHGPTGVPFTVPPQSSTFMGQPPPPPPMHGASVAGIPNGFYATPAGITTGDMTENGLNGDNIQMQCMYPPPPLQFYYTTNGGGPPAMSTGTLQGVAGNSVGNLGGNNGTGTAAGGGGGGMTTPTASSHGVQG